MVKFLGGMGGRTLRAALLWAAVVGVGLAACASRTTAPAPQVTPAGVRFVFTHSSARSVALAASFNQWSTVSHFMAPSASGRWSIVTPLPPGEHTFMFVVDGQQWVSPPAAEDYVDDGFGARNGVVVVRPSER